MTHIPNSEHKTIPGLSFASKQLKYEYKNYLQVVVSLFNFFILINVKKLPQMAVDIVVKNKINIGYKSSMSNQIKLIIIENTIYYEKKNYSRYYKINIMISIYHIFLILKSLTARRSLVPWSLWSAFRLNLWKVGLSTQQAASEVCLQNIPRPTCFISRNGLR